MKKSVLKTAIILAFIMILFAFSGCSNSVNFSGTYFNTFVYIYAEGGKEPIYGPIKELFDSFDNSLSLTKNSTLKALNEWQEESPFVLDDITLIALNESLSLYGFLDGYYNPAVLPSLKLWRLSSDTFDRLSEFTIPENQAVLEKKALSDKFSEITVYQNGIIKPKGVELDFGGIAKGMLADKIKTILIDKGYNFGYISLGGSSISVLKVKEDLKIIHPRKDGYILAVKNSLINGKSLSTSGDYMRYYIKDDKYYSHVINPKTGKPTETGFSSVTVIGKDGYKCDAISTALMNMEKDDFINFTKNNLNEYSVFGVIDSDKKIITNKEQGDFTLLDGTYSIEYV